eukprot:m.41809 g.41809  ORF g.41809 m.41809 type:complete len:482 (+) comp7025_c1_seq1:305-1750(+)
MSKPTNTFTLHTNGNNNDDDNNNSSSNFNANNSNDSQIYNSNNPRRKSSLDGTKFPSPLAQVVTVPINKSSNAVTNNTAHAQNVNRNARPLSTEQMIIESLQRDCSIKDSRIQDLERAVQTMQKSAQNPNSTAAEHQRLMSRLQMLEQRNVELSRVVKELENDGKILARSNGDKDSQIQSLLQQINALRRQHTDVVVKQVDGPSQENESLRRENSILRQDLEELHEQLTDEYEKKAARATHSHVDMNALPPLPDGSRPCVEDLEAITIVRLEEKNSELEQRTQQLENHIHQLVEKNTELKKVVEKETSISTQLALETETIGEYISLYQQQRRAMAMQLREKDEYIQQLNLSIEHVRAELDAVRGTQPVSALSSSSSSSLVNSEYKSQDSTATHVQNALEQSENDVKSRKGERVALQPPPPRHYSSSNHTPIVQYNPSQPLNSQYDDTLEKKFGEDSETKVPEWVQASMSHGYYAKFAVLSI